MRKKNAYLLIALLLLIFVGCQKKDKIQSDETKKDFKEPETTSIIGGDPINIVDRPYQVGVFAGPQLGGGTIIGDQWILTAAHVVTYMNPASPLYGQQIPANQISITSGSTNLFLGNTSYVDQVIRHESYSTSSNLNDIALIHLSSPLAFDAYTRPIVYSTSEETISVNDLAITSGWGDTVSYDSGNISAQLYSTNVKISNISSPSLIYSQSPTSNQQGVCTGDSGGPLTISNSIFGEVLAGVVNFVQSDCTVGYSGYARVSYFADWIKTKTGGLDRPRLQGQSSFCTSATYSINNLPAGATVSWSNAYSGIATLTTSGNTATLNTNAGGTLDLNAAVTVGSQVFNLTRNIIARKALDINDASIYATIAEGGYNKYFNNLTENASGEYSIVLSEIVDPYTYGGVVSIADPNVTNMNIIVSSSSGIASVGSMGAGSAMIKLKGITASATFKVTYSNSCGSNVIQYVYVRAPNGVHYH